MKVHSQQEIQDKMKMRISSAFVINRVLLPVLMAAMVSACDKDDPVVHGSLHRDTISVIPHTHETKSSVTTTLGLENKGRFVLEAYVDDIYCDFENDPEGENPFPAGKYINRVATGNVIYGSGTWSIAPVAYWVQNVNTTFWCWAPATMTTIPDDISTSQTTFTVNDYASPYNSDLLTFIYARPGVATFPLLNPNGTLNAKSEQFRDADIQDDIILAYAKQHFSKPKGNDKVNLVFYHPLSQIRFAVSPDDGKFDSSLRIVQIAIKNIKQGGVCTFHGAESNETDKFTWDLNASPVTSYCQTYNAGFNTAPDGWAAGTYHDGVATRTLYTTKNVFFVTPQTLTSEAKLDILFEDRGTYIEVEKDLRDLLKPEDNTWKPGLYYTYKINATVLGRTIKVGVSLLDWQKYDDKLFI